MYRKVRMPNIASPVNPSSLRSELGKKYPYLLEKKEQDVGEFYSNLLECLCAENPAARVNGMGHVKIEMGFTCQSCGRNWRQSDSCDIIQPILPRGQQSVDSQVSVDNFFGDEIMEVKCEKCKHEYADVTKIPEL